MHTISIIAVFDYFFDALFLIDNYPFALDHTSDRPFRCSCREHASFAVSVCITHVKLELWALVQFDLVISAVICGQVGLVGSYPTSDPEAFWTWVARLTKCTECTETEHAFLGTTILKRSIPERHAPNVQYLRRHQTFNT